MEEASTVRLVRCPKCENLLPELPDFSVYQCGGCGAVLRAKNKGIQEGESSGKSDNANEVRNSDVGKNSESEPKNPDRLEGVKAERIGDERAVLNRGSSSNLDNGDAFADSYTDTTGKEVRQEIPDRDRFKNPEPSLNSPVRNDLRANRVVGNRNGSMDSRGHERNSGAAVGRFGNFHYGARDFSDELDEKTPRAEKTETDHADLLRRIEELKDQISRSSDVRGGKSDRRSGGYFPGSSSDSNVRNRQFPAPDDDLFLKDRRNPYFAPPRTDAYGASLPDSRPWERMRYEDSYRAEMIRRNYHHSNPRYAYYGRDFQGYYGDYFHEDLPLHRRENLFHQPACSCPQCCNKNLFFPPGIDRLGSRSRTNDGILKGNKNHRSNLLHPQPSNPWDFDSENEGFLSHQRPRKFAVAQRRARVSYPVAGGAPFATCKNCFELLKLPRMNLKDRQEIKCGACSCVIAFEPGGNNEVIIPSVAIDVERVPSEIGERFSTETFDENNFSNISDAKSENDGFSPFGKKSNSFSSTSCDEKIPGTEKKRGSSSSEIPSETINSVLHSSDHCDNGNRSARSERERVSSLGRNISRQIPSSVDAEDVDMPLHEISNNRSSVETHAREDSNRGGGNKTGKSFLAGLIKKSFRDSTAKPTVFVNGHAIPHDLVKRAEKMAGPVQPGEYWYDKRAGFWGAMGHPCSGIIMPNIEEFNYPLPGNCAAGNTGIFMNGRELHQQDLDLLANRGLPIERNRAYLIEITGEVVDEHTGEELDPLGKLAPTVEKAKKGFGMKVPKAVLQ